MASGETLLQSPAFIDEMLTEGWRSAPREVDLAILHVLGKIGSLPPSAQEVPAVQHARGVLDEIIGRGPDQSKSDAYDRLVWELTYNLPTSISE